MPRPSITTGMPPSEWSAQVDYDAWSDRWVEKDKIIIHYGGGANTAGSVNPSDAQQVADEMSVLRGWERFHINGRGWRGIAYNWAVGQSGVLYRLRGWNLNGAQYTSDDLDGDGISSNYEGVAVVFILGGDQQPTPAAITTFGQLRAFLEDTLGVPLPLFGHQEAAAAGGHSTSCPGVHLMRFIEQDRQQGGTVVRIAGSNRYETAAKVSEAGWPDGADTVLVVSGANFADAVAAAPLAALLGCPVLLTDPRALSSETAAEIRRLNPSTIRIVGGPAAVSEQVASDLSHLGLPQ